MTLCSLKIAIFVINSCPLCNLKDILNIFMNLFCWIEHHETTDRAQVLYLRIIGLWPFGTDNCTTAERKKPDFVMHIYLVITSPHWKGRETCCFPLPPPVCLSVTKSCPLYNLITIRDILTKFHTLVDVICKRTITLACLFFKLFPFSVI